jgi:hypothetical protein
LYISSNKGNNELYNKSESSKIIQGWNIDTVESSIGVSKYLTNFGDENINIDKSIGPNLVEYAKATFKIHIQRDSWSLFLKVFLCMYISFLIAYVSFFIHHESIDSRISLSVGALFAVIGNKYITESSLPESLSFTLVDTLHSNTMFFILLIITMNTYILKLVNDEKYSKAKKIDRISLVVIFTLYFLSNLYFVIVSASHI